MKIRRVTLVAAALLGILSGVLAGCGTGTLGGAPGTPAATATPVPPKVLYQSAWPAGLDAWHPDKGWSIVDGAPQSDVNGDVSMAVPYQPTDQPYAVNVPIQIVDVKDFGAFFAFGPAPTDGGNGYSASIYSLPASSSPKQFGQHPTIGVSVLPTEAQRSGPMVFDYEPTANMRTYRIEVRGSRVDFLVDGREMSYAAATTAHFSKAPLMLRTQGVSIRLGQVTVETLSN